MEGRINTGDHDPTLQMSLFPGGRNANYGGIAPAQTDQSTRKQQVPQGLPPQGQGAARNMDPKRLKRVTASREYSQRYRLKQMQYIAQLEAGVRALQAEVAITIPRIKCADTQNSLLRAENNSIKQKLANSTGQLMFKQAEYHELKKERDALKQMSLMSTYHHAPAPPPSAADQTSSQTKHYVVNNLAMDDAAWGFNHQFTAGAAGASSNMPNNQNLVNQFGIILPPDQSSFVPSRSAGPNNEDGNDNNPI